MATASVFFSLLFLFTLSHARDIQNPFPHPKPLSEPEPKPHDTVSFPLHTIDPVPLTLLHFRPINRHLHPGRPLPLPSQLPLSLRNGHRRCRHGHRREISYGNDMLVDASGGSRQIPTRWVRAHSVAEPRLPEMMGHPDSDHEHLHHVHREHHHHHHRSWFAKRFREFLNLF
ncbi:protein naked cuticle homolog 2-like [Abrus precatorius]|uniref:Protein naked cuticle homolog 2-like n=1 Tax=Abrus precatorius TaxID=3816 RepID=A0A8B8KQJ7_ABRPR|nr:protein naked cuticle homolog 2-like [Abrus precatorius]